jgi:hypothetical protein
MEKNWQRKNWQSAENKHMESVVFRWLSQKKLAAKSINRPTDHGKSQLIHVL